MIKKKIATLLIVLLTTPMCIANTTIEKSHPCTMKDLAVMCENGDKVNLDVVSSTDQRGEVFLNINTQDGNVGNYLLLYIDNSKKPEVLRVEKGTNTVNVSKGAFVPRNIIMKLRSASSVRFEIGMQKRSPISGSLSQTHFEWLQRFGKVCY
ncbi:MAG: hypothetical protein AB7I18_04105 [Candidatus Berkiella sp.]